MKTHPKIVLLFVALVCHIIAFAGTKFNNGVPENQQSQNNYLPVNISIFYPLSVNKNDSVITNFNLSWIYGKVGYVYGVDLSGCVNQTTRDVQGYEAAGIANIVGNSMQGFQSAGIYNYVGGDASFFQSAGIVNFVEGDFHGFQSAGIFNMAERNFSGFQASGIANILKGNLKGVQASLVNVAENSDGAQISLVNITKKVRGTQIGLVNIAKRIDGIPIGLINYAEDGKVHLVVWGSNILLYNLGVKFAVNDYFYSMFHFGYNNLSKDVTKSIAAGYSMGFHFPLQYSLFFDLDFKAYSIVNDMNFNFTEDVGNQNMLQTNLVIGCTLMEKLSFFAGIGQSYILDTDQTIGAAKKEFLLLAGVQLF